MEAIEMRDLELGRKAGYSHLGREEMGKDHTIYVSDSAWANLAEMANSRGMSRSALIDAIGRGLIVLGDSDDPIANIPPPPPPQSTPHHPTQST
jgi:hypothetical protein